MKELLKGATASTPKLRAKCDRLPTLVQLSCRRKLNLRRFLLSSFAALGRPILSGPSRKSFMKTALGDVPPGERVWGTAAAVTASVLAGAHLVRVHDVREMVQVVRVADAIRAAALGEVRNWKPDAGKS